jgi:uncharacterized membrane protein YraQ (UPF0718 family)
MQVLGWLNDVFLRMTWLSDLAKWIVEGVLRLKISDPLGGSIHFFLLDVTKIFILLGVLIFMISFIQSYFPPERTRKILGRFKGIWGNIFGALLGTITPFCSCSSIPIFIGFTGAGLPMGTTFSFLISSPLVDLASIILLASIFNWKIALAYVVIGVLLAIAGGTFVSMLKMEDQIEEFVTKNPFLQFAKRQPTRNERIDSSWKQVKIIVKKVWIYVLIGVGIGAAIHNWIPKEWITAVLGQDKWYSVIVATLVGIPMYADTVTILPIAEALVSKGVGLGTVLAFMMAVTALSAPSIILLKNVIKTKLLVLFIGFVTVGIILIGYLFNAYAYLLF